MSIQTEYDSLHQLLRVTVSGAWPTIAEQAAARQALLDEGRVTPDLAVLIDLRGVAERAAPDLGTVRRAVTLAVEQGTARVKRAFLTSSTAQLGTARMILELANVVLGAKVGVFTDEAEAISWLTDRSD